MSKSRPASWGIALPALVVLGIVAAWCGFWLFASDMAQRRFAALGDQGVRIDCTGERWAGFPFRITLVCDQPSFTLDRDGLTLSGSGTRLSATARIYAPGHVIAELAGPSTLTQTRSPDPSGAIPDQVTVQSAAAPIRAGLQLGLDGLRRVSLRLDGWSGTLSTRVRGHGTGSARITAGTLALHWARGGETPDSRTIALDARDLSIAGTALAALGEELVTVERAELAATATRIPPRSEGGLPETLRAWQAAGGTLEIGHLAIDTRDRHVTGTGTLRLDSAGRLDGTVDLVVRDLERVFEELVASGRIEPNQAVLASTALTLLTRGAPAPEPGWSRVPVRLSRGRLYFGPFKAAEIPPLF